MDTVSIITTVLTACMSQCVYIWSVRNHHIKYYNCVDCLYVSVCISMGLMCMDTVSIIMYLYKICILHHGMQRFHIFVYCMPVYCTPVYCTPVYCTLVYWTIADRSDCFANLISLREHANERYADRCRSIRYLGMKNIYLMLFN